MTNVFKLAGISSISKIFFAKELIGELVEELNQNLYVIDYSLVTLLQKSEKSVK